MSAEEHIKEVVDFHSSAALLIETGCSLHSKGWMSATSGDLSVRISEEHFAISVSGCHKGDMSEQDVMMVDRVGSPVAAGNRPSPDTLLHTALYNRYPQLGAVLHTHSVKATLLSRLSEEELIFEDYELLKAFEGVQSHKERIVVPIFPNDQDIPRLSLQVEDYLDNHPAVHGYLIAGHGLYTWGSTMREALRHIDAFEFLFECELTMRSL